MFYQAHPHGLKCPVVKCEIVRNIQDSIFEHPALNQLIDQSKNTERRLCSQFTSDRTNQSTNLNPTKNKRSR